MKNSTIISMTALVVLAMLTLLALNFHPISFSRVTTADTTPNTAEWISNGEIRGMAVIHKGIPFTLNFDEQQIAQDAIMRAVSVKTSDYPQIKGPFDFDKLIIYRFHAPDVELIPIQFSDLNLVFSMPMLNRDKYYMELSGGSFKDMISKSFDP